jgi:hypothetical protein
MNALSWLNNNQISSEVHSLISQSPIPSRIVFRKRSPARGLIPSSSLDAVAECPLAVPVRVCG